MPFIGGFFSTEISNAKQIFDGPFSKLPALFEL